MRLSPFEITTIKQCVTAIDPAAQVYLFGSRVHDHLKGGDIDLLVISNKISLMDKIHIKQQICDAIGEQKIDLVIPNPSNQAFVKMAMQEGILL